MRKFWLALIAGLVLGGSLGASLAQRSIHQRQKGLAVMWLLQFHVDELQVAAQSTDCAATRRALARLSVMADELAGVFARANAEDADFHRASMRLQQVVAPVTTANACANPGEALKTIRAACADCHRDYR